MKENCLHRCPRIEALSLQFRRESSGLSPSSCEYDEVWARANEQRDEIIEQCSGPEIISSRKVTHVEESPNIISRMIGQRTTKVVELPVYGCSSRCDDRDLVTVAANSRSRQDDNKE